MIVDPAQYNYLFQTGYIFNIASKTRFFPSVLVSYSPGEKINVRY